MQGGLVSKGTSRTGCGERSQSGPRATLTLSGDSQQLVACLMGRSSRGIRIHWLSRSRLSLLDKWGGRILVSTEVPSMGRQSCPVHNGGMMPSQPWPLPFASSQILPKPQDRLDPSLAFRWCHVPVISPIQNHCGDQLPIFSHQLLPVLANNKVLGFARAKWYALPVFLKKRRNMIGCP